MPIARSEAVVLSRHSFRETSLIAEFYTRDYGKVNGLLKGIRTDPKKFASTLEPFSHNEIIFYRRLNSNLQLVSQCDLIENFNSIRQELARVGMASFVCELTGALMPEEEKNEEVFSLMLQCLRELDVGNNPERAMIIFKIKMLGLSGFRPHFDSCVSCGLRIISECKFSLRLGGLLCAKCSGKDPASRAIFRGTVASILHIEKNDFSSNLKLGMNPQIKKELGIVLNSFLNFHLEKELKSQRVLDKLCLKDAASAVS